MSANLTRRGLLIGGSTAIAMAAPAIVRASSLMPVRVWNPYTHPYDMPELGLMYCDGRQLSRRHSPELYRLLAERYGARLPIVGNRIPALGPITRNIPQISALHATMIQAEQNVVRRPIGTLFDIRRPFSPIGRLESP